MIVEQLWVGNSLRNFNYLIACPETGDALAIDPLDTEQVLSVARQRGLKITQIVNTHHHGDHTGGNKALVAATGARLIAHRDALDKIRNVDRGVAAGDRIRVGKTVELDCLDTPGHTMSHVCLLSKTDPPALFSGDTLFNAGAGNCHNGGHPEALYTTFVSILAALPDATRVYPGHDYVLNNLRFALDREPDNAAAKACLEEFQSLDPVMHVMTLGQEKAINPFFRLSSASLVGKLKSEFGEDFDEKGVFLKLRELRNSW
jgi:hydroxyacylglutathione hydrolase